MFRRHSLLIILAALAVVTAKETNAQPTVEAATLLGVVEDPSGARIPGATLILRSDRSPLLKIVESAGRGQFEIAGVPHGSYTLTATAPGFADADVAAVVPASAPLVIVLRPAAVIEEVRVTSVSRQDELRALLNTRVDVVTRARIDDTGAQTVGEVLRELPGVVTRRGSEGTPPVTRSKGSTPSRCSCCSMACPSSAPGASSVEAPSISIVSPPNGSSALRW